MLTPSRRDFLKAVSAAIASSATGWAQDLALFRYPHVQNVRRTRATIRWATREPGNGAVEFWDDSNERQRAVSEVTPFLPAETGMSSAYYRHECLLTRLTPGSSYQYRIEADGEPLMSDGLNFRTPGTRPFEFLAFGDSGMGTPEQRQIAGRMLAHSADFILHTGDLVYPTGTWERYESLYFEYYRDLMKNAPFFPCPGNHDYYETNCIPYRAMHSLPDDAVARADYGRYYSFDWGNAHFISLDSNDALRDAVAKSGAMLEWLENDLRQTNKFWRIVFLHHPAYSVGLHHADENEGRWIRQYIAPILDRYAAPLVMNGHVHSYQRTAALRAGKVTADGEGTVWVTTGGGGANLHPVGSADYMIMAASLHHYVRAQVSGARLQIQALLPNGTELDSVTLAPKPVFESGHVVNAATYRPELAAGGLVSIFGFHLAPDDFVATKYPLPRSASGTVVLLNDEPLPILMASATQINVQLPYHTSGAAVLRIRTGNGEVSRAISIAAAAPALFADAIFHQDGTPVTADQPARAGETIGVYLTGLGPVDGAVEVGAAAERWAASIDVAVLLDRVRIRPVFAGLARGLAGVNEVSFVVPAGSAASAPLKIEAAGAQSNTVILPLAP